MALDPKDQKLVDDVAKHGWRCMHIGAGNGEPNFSYSVGWWESINQPEALVFGLRNELHHSMLWELFRQLKAGAPLHDGARFAGLIEGFDCIVRPIHRSQIQEYFGFAIWYRRYRKVDPKALEAYQLFWPGKVNGLFPWESGAEEVRSYQPLLYLPRGVTGVA